MNIRQLSVYAVVALVSGSAGAWLMLTLPGPTGFAAPAGAPAVAGAAAGAATGAATHSPTAVAAMTSRASAPLIAVSSDGTATLRVEQQPLEWVLEEIGKQSGWPDVHDRVGAGRRLVAAAAAPDPAAAGCTAVPGGVRPPPTTLLQALAQGTDDQRYDSLRQARAEGLSLPDDTLKRLYENDASDRLRSLAFQRLLEGRASGVDEMRGALEAGLAVPNEAVRAEARRRLDSLLDGQGIDTSLQ